jgi:hypothetical protein
LESGIQDPKSTIGIVNSHGFHHHGSRYFFRDPPAAGTEVWHEFMAPGGVETDVGGEPLPALRPTEMAFPRAHDE